MCVKRQCMCVAYVCESMGPIKQVMTLCQECHLFRQRCKSSLSLPMLIVTFPIDEHSLVAVLIVGPKAKPACSLVPPSCPEIHPSEFFLPSDASSRLLKTHQTAQDKSPRSEKAINDCSSGRLVGCRT